MNEYEVYCRLYGKELADEVSRYNEQMMYHRELSSWCTGPVL